MGLALDCDFLAIKDFALTCVSKVHGSVSEAFNLRQYVSECIDRQLHATAHLDLHRRAEVVVTKLPWCTSIRFSEFASLAELKEALLASCCMTPLAGFPFRMDKADGSYVFDGGLSDFQPLFDESEGEGPTVTVSPFYFTQAHIKPSRYIPCWWALYPPRPADFEWVFDLGYADCLYYCSDRGLMTHFFSGVSKATQRLNASIQTSMQAAIQAQAQAQAAMPNSSNPSSSTGSDLHLPESAVTPHHDVYFSKSLLNACRNPRCRRQLRYVLLCIYCTCAVCIQIYSLT